MLERFKLIKGDYLLGSGTYGAVYKVIERKTNKLLAIKKMNLEIVSEGIPATTLREICILREFTNSKYILSL